MPFLQALCYFTANLCRQILKHEWDTRSLTLSRRCNMTDSHCTVLALISLKSNFCARSFLRNRIELYWFEKIRPDRDVTSEEPVFLR